MWEQLNRLYLQVNSTTSSEAWLLHSYVFFRAVREGAHLVSWRDRLHDVPWRGLAIYSAGTIRGANRRGGAADRRLLQPAVRSTPLDQAVESEEYLEWVGLLKNCAAFEAYCKKYTAELRPLRVAEFLLLNPEFPHSVRFSVDKVHAALLAIAELTERKRSSRCGWQGGCEPR